MRFEIANDGTDSKDVRIMRLNFLSPLLNHVQKPGF